MEVNLTAPQFDFVTATEQFPALVAGFGAGKSHAGIWRSLTMKLAYPAQDVAYYLPTYDLVGRMAIPRFEEVLTDNHIPFKTNKNDSVVSLERRGDIILRTMDNPARIVAYEVADSIADELDTLPIDKAREVWNKIIARNRQKKPDGALNTAGVVTTPEGFRFVYERWKKLPAAGYRLFRASTMSNAANLPPGYIDSLKASYSPALLQAYLDGEFVNLTSGSVHAEFDRDLNNTTAEMKPGEPLHIGMDFNVGRMSATVSVIRDNEPLVVDEITGVLDTPAMIAEIKKRYVGHPILVYPDASGNSRKSNNASESDISLLRAAKFNVLVATTNPAVKDRILSLNRMIHSHSEIAQELGVTSNPLIGKRRLKINSDRCPNLVESLEKQAYDKNGEPDKKSGFDHLNEALGYFIYYRYPVRGRAMQKMTLGGV